MKTDYLDVLTNKDAQIHNGLVEVYYDDNPYGMIATLFHDGQLLAMMQLGVTWYVSIHNWYTPQQFYICKKLLESLSGSQFVMSDEFYETSKSYTLSADGVYYEQE